MRSVGGLVHKRLAALVTSIHFSSCRSFFIPIPSSLRSSRTHLPRIVAHNQQSQQASLVPSFQQESSATFDSPNEPPGTEQRTSPNVPDRFGSGRSSIHSADARIRARPGQKSGGGLTTGLNLNLRSILIFHKILPSEISTRRPVNSSIVHALFNRWLAL
jgi:hypothetical protein